MNKKQRIANIAGYTVLLILQVYLAIGRQTPLSGIVWALLYLGVLLNRKYAKGILYFWGGITIVLGLGNLYSSWSIMTFSYRITTILIVLLALGAIALTFIFEERLKK